MKPVRLFMKNFMNHSNTEIDFTQFQSAIIIGKNKNNNRLSNGIGKTTIFRGIEYVLFNIAHGTTLDKIVRDGKKKAVVEFDFELNGEMYRIYRHRTATGFSDVRMYKRVLSEWESISERTPSATDALIRSKIKISHKAFTFSVLFRQADLEGIAAVEDPKKRKEILKEPLNLSMYTKLEDIASDRRRPLKRKVDSIEGSISVLGDPDADIVKSEEELLDISKSICSNKNQILILEESLIQKRASIDDLKQLIGKQDVDIHKNLSENENNLNKLKENYKYYTKRLVELLSLIRSKELSVSNSLVDMENYQIDLNKLSADPIVDINDLQSKLDSTRSDEIKGSEILAGIRAQMSLIQKTIPDGDECPACRQDITPDYRQKISNDANEKLKKIKSDIDFYEDALGKCRKKKNRLEDSVRSERDRVSRIQHLETKIKNIKENQKSLKEDISIISADQEDATNKLKSYENQINETQEHLESLREAASKSDAPVINDKILKLNKNISEIQESITELNSKISRLSSVRGGLEERISSRKRDKDKLSELLSDLKKVKAQLRISQMVVDAFSNRGIPSFIIQTVLDELQFEANKALKELRPELDVKIDSDLNFTYRRNGVERDYSQLSYGQHVYIALAFKRGISRILQRNQGVDLKLLEFDEYDAHLDDEGVDAFYKAICKWQNDFTILVITHKKHLQDKFSSAILVEEGDDGAEAKLVSSW